MQEFSPSPSANEYKDYGYFSPDTPSWAEFVYVRILSVAEEEVPCGRERRMLDIGCGNGHLVGEFLKRGYKGVGVDPSESGVQAARTKYPSSRFEALMSDDQILHNLGEAPFELVVMAEVIEHIYDPVKAVRGAFSAVRPGGLFICTTPYHGYLKNLVLAVTNRFDYHLDPFWLGGHIKFWSFKTLSRLLKEAGFIDIHFRGGVVGLPYLWKSMVVSARRPSSGSVPDQERRSGYVMRGRAEREGWPSRRRSRSPSTGPPIGPSPF